MAKSRKVIAKTDPLAFPPHEYQDVMALKAVYAGTATQGQQIRAMQWIIKKAGNIGGIGYDRDHDSDIVFNDGRRFVAGIIVALIEEPRDQVKKRFPETRLGDLPENPADVVPLTNEETEDD